MATINFTGLASGIDTRALIDAILSVERKPIERLQLRESTLTLQKSAFEDLRSRLNGLESAARDLSQIGTVRARATSVSNESVLRASAGSTAEIGLFSVEVQALAAAHKVRSDGLAAPDQGLVSDGTITIQSGSNNLITVDVQAASGNNTLEAVRDAINAADAGVSAAILFDGTDYLLTVRSKETGTANALTITDSTNLGLDDPGNEITAAADASLTVDGISVTSSSNKVSNVIPGVTLDLLSTTSGTPVTVEVKPDVDRVAGAVQELVSKYNELIDYFNEQTNRDDPGPLNGEFTLRRVQLKLQSLFTAGVEGIPLGGIRSLSSLGVSFDGKTGRATLDNGTLRDLLETRFDEIGDLFLASGTTSDPRIKFFSSAKATQSGEYAVEITSAAEQATVAGSDPITSLNQDETLTITVGADSTNVLLNKNDTITDVVDAVNVALQGAGIAATAVDDGGKLRISTDEYGSAADVTVVSDRANQTNGKQSGFDTAPTSDTGEDLAGSIGGVPGTVNGNLLTGAAGEPFEGLVLQINVTAADVAATGGDFGTVSFTRGFADMLLAEIDTATRFDSGSIDVAKEAIEADLKRIAEDISRFEERLSTREAQLIRAFSEAERAIAALQAQQAGASTFTLL